MGEKLESMISPESSEKKVVVKVAPEALLEEKNFFLALGIHKPHQVPDKRNILGTNFEC